MGEWIEEVLPVGSFDDEGFYAGDEASAQALDNMSIALLSTDQF